MQFPSPGAGSGAGGKCSARAASARLKGMIDGEMEVIEVRAIDGDRATVILPDTSEEDWSLAALPPEVQAGDLVGITVDDGQFDVELLPRPRSPFQG